MLSITSKICNIKNDYPEFNFTVGEDFFWSYQDHTIYYIEKSKCCLELLLHELSHALLGHNGYDYDIELIKKERQAWDDAKKIAKKYNVDIKNDFIQSNLDSYREWIHLRSTCPNCRATGVQYDKQSYECPVCKRNWHVNEAKKCKLKRYIENK